MVKRRDTKNRILRQGEYQREDGRYEYRYTMNGKRKVVYSWKLTATDSCPDGKKKELSLREKEELIEKDIWASIDIEGAYMTFSDIATKYFASKVCLNKNTLDNCMYLFNAHIKQSDMGNKKINGIKNFDVKMLYQSLVDDGLSNGSIHFIHSNIVGPIFEFAVQNDYIRKNPSKGCLKEYPYSRYGHRCGLSLKEQKIFLDFLKNDRVYGKYYLIVILMLNLGLRRSEVLGLTWDDIDFENKILCVTHQIHYRSKDKKYSFYAGKPKSEAGYRDIPLSDALIKELSLYKEEEEQRKRRKISIDGYTNFLFYNSQESNLIIPRQLSDSLKQCGEKYNKKETVLAAKERRNPELLPTITAHVLRHTACTRMAESHIDPKVIQVVMGHASAVVTMNVYNHVDRIRLLKEMERKKTVI